MSESNSLNTDAIDTFQEQALPPIEAMTIREFGRRYSLCRASVYVEIREGRLAARKVGGKTIILRTDADRWVENLPRIKPRKPGAGRPPKYPDAGNSEASAKSARHGRESITPSLLPLSVAHSGLPRRVTTPFGWGE